ncbi:MAG: hypothetical protein ACRDBG_24800, partial [Waterburya sp.]
VVSKGLTAKVVGLLFYSTTDKEMIMEMHNILKSKFDIAMEYLDTIGTRIEVCEPAKLWEAFMKDRQKKMEANPTQGYTQLWDTDLDRPRIIVGIDPGQTTGWTVYFPGFNQFICGQTDTSTFYRALGLIKMLTTFASGIYGAPRFVIEDYRVYGYKADDHKWESLYTSQVIGVYKAWLCQQNMMWHTQMAIKGKQWCTDDRLKSLNLYCKGVKHGRDSMRHVITSLLFCDKIVRGEPGDDSDD